MMSQRINVNRPDLTAIRHRIWQTTLMDGLLDIFVGIYLAAFAAFFLSDALLGDTNVFIYLLPAILLPSFWRPLKQRFTHPRIGEVEVLPEQKNLLLLGLGMFFLLLGLVVFTAFNNDSEAAMRPIELVFENAALLLGIIVGGLFLFMGCRFGLGRYAVYGALALAAGVIIQAAGFTLETDLVALRWGVWLAVMAAAMLPTGIVLFWRFLRGNPVLAEEETGDER